MWVAPNLITITGLVINMVAALLLIYHCPSAREEVRTIKFLKETLQPNLAWKKQYM